MSSAEQASSMTPVLLPREQPVRLRPVEREVAEPDRPGREPPLPPLRPRLLSSLVTPLSRI